MISPSLRMTRTVMLLGQKSKLWTWRKQVANRYLLRLYPCFNFSSNFNLILLYNLIIICYFHQSIICYIMFSLFHFDNSNWRFWKKMQRNPREPEKQLHFLVLWQIVLLGHKSMLLTWRKQVANRYLPILYPCFNF